MTDPVVIAYDEGPRAGLGHRRRCEALASALLERGIDVVALAIDAESSAATRADVLVVDSYQLRADDQARFEARVTVALDDLDRNLAVDLVIDPSPGALASTHAAAGWAIAGSDYALVAKPRVTARRIGAPPERVLITAGAADRTGVGASIAAALAARCSGLDLRLVIGPWGARKVPNGVRAVEAPDGLADELAHADVVVTAGGVTMLESCVLGRPTVAAAIVSNQERAVRELGRVGAVVACAPANAATEATRLLVAPDRRVALALAARAAIDGEGPGRVADAIVATLAGAVSQ